MHSGRGQKHISGAAFNSLEVQPSQQRSASMPHRLPWWMQYANKTYVGAAHQGFGVLLWIRLHRVVELPQPHGLERVAHGIMAVGDLTKEASGEVVLAPHPLHILLKLSSLNSTLLHPNAQQNRHLEAHPCVSARLRILLIAALQVSHLLQPIVCIKCAATVWFEPELWLS